MTTVIIKSLYDIKLSIESIAIHLDGINDYSDFKNSFTVKRAIERELEIIGEAVNRILREDKDVKLSNARRIVDLRNYIIHAYDAVDDEIIWSIITKHIPLLKTEIENILSELKL